MGLLDSLITLARDANENAHSVRLHKDLFPTMQMVNDLPDHLQELALRRFLMLRGTIIPNISNWSRDGVIKASRTLFSEAQKLQDFDRCNSLGYALAGLWLESSARTGESARAVFQVLEKLAATLTESGQELTTTQANHVGQIDVEETKEPAKKKPKKAKAKVGLMPPRSAKPIKQTDYIKEYEPMASSLGEAGASRVNVFNLLTSAGCPDEYAKALAEQFGKYSA